MCRFGAPLSTFGISAELNIHVMNAIHQFEKKYQLNNVKYEILYPKSNFQKYHNFRHVFTITFFYMNISITPKWISVRFSPVVASTQMEGIV